MIKRRLLSAAVILSCVVFALIGCYREGLPTDLPAQETITNEREIQTVNVYCGDNKAEIELADNPSAKAFYERLKEGDVTVVMDDYGDFEKVGELGFSLVQSNAQITVSSGDVILYQGDKITIYYDTNGWNFTRLGKIKDMTREKMLAFFGGKGEATVTFSLK